MTQDAERLFLQAVELTPEQRRIFLLEQCTTDEMRSEVESLLAGDDKAESFLESAVLEAAGSLKQVMDELAAATSLKTGRFPPGTMIAGRFRIDGLLGKGGMGEVYRAYDAQLEQAVALKFLPEKAAGNPDAMARLRKEVRIARQVSHPNVCRVYDIGQVQGRAYIAMEYVDGESLDSLLRRIGRVPADKAVEIARQLCAGLTAAHDKGVLHRDLKPANIMIDGRGEVLLTDFGIACFDKEALDSHMCEGTPAYMAPEQLAGQGVSVRSELYALGLVLYEIFTGKRAFEAASFKELLRQHQELPLTNPSFLVKDLDPAVESVILRCLDPDPRNRHQSARAVAAALPGGDVLAAALAAGRTPSPETVAATADPITLHPAVGVLLLTSVLLGLVTAAFFSGKVNLTGTARLSRTPDVLVQKARDIIDDLGYTEPPADSAYGFQYDADYLSYVLRNGNVPNPWSRLATHQPALVHLWYRQSPWPLEPVSSFANKLGSTQVMTIAATVSPTVPPHTVPGMIRVQVDALGRLIGLDAVPPQTENPGTGIAPPDWNALFRAAGLNPAVFSPAQPERIPPAPFDNRAAWTGKYPGVPETPLHIEAAAWRGRPVFFHIFGPWKRADAAASQQLSPWRLVGISLLNLWTLSVVLGAALLARHNLRAGRGDTRGALRLALFVGGVCLLAWVLVSHHVPVEAELRMFYTALIETSSIVGAVWVIYLALEPYVRRRWPQTIIGWSRILAGRLRDPLVGADLLVGVIAGIAWTLLFQIHEVVMQRLGHADWWMPSLDVLLGARYVAGHLLGLCVPQSIAHSLAILFAVLGVSVLLHSRWLAGLLTVAGLTLMSVATFGSDHPLLAAPLWVLFYGGVILVLLRFGLVALMTGFFVLYLLRSSMVTGDLSSWYGGTSMFVLVGVFAIGTYGFYAALYSRPLFR